MNNNVNNAENQSGMNFVQGNVPVNSNPVGGASGANGMNQMSQGVNQAPMVGMQTVNNQMSGFMPQQQSASFVSNGVSSQMQQGQGASQNVNQQSIGGMSNANMPMPGVMPGQLQTPSTPMQNFSQPMMQGGVQQPSMMPNGGMMGNVGNDVNTGGYIEGEKPKSPIVLIIITILVVVGVAVFLILFLTGKINFGASNTNNQENGNITEDIGDFDGTNELTDWMNYLLEQNISEIKLSRYTDADGGASEETLSNPTVVNLTKEQLKNIFTQMMDYNLVKYYASGRGMSTDDELHITYTGDDGNIGFWISGGRIGFDNESKLLEAFENSEYTTQSDGETSVDSENYNFILENFDSAIFSAYFENITDDSSVETVE